MKTLMVIVILLSVVSCSTTGVITPELESNTSSLGDELRFPSGWSPVMLAAGSARSGSTKYTFVCERDNVYRFCTPEVIKQGN